MGGGRWWRLCDVPIEQTKDCPETSWPAEGIAGSQASECPKVAPDVGATGAAFRQSCPHASLTRLAPFSLGIVA
jgi:hypothetical protein